MDLSTDIIDSFDLKGDIVPLMGGQNTSVKINNAVLKPVDDVKHYEWLLNLIYNINPQRYRLSKPLRNKSGKFVSDGWICTRFEPGHEIRGCIQEKLRISRLFHRDLSNESILDFPDTNNPWSKAHRVAWQIDDLPNGLPKETHGVIYDLLKRIIPKGNNKMQIVHSDLSGNILFDEALDPLIIDFSPTIAPVEYAEAILVCDCIAWQESKISEIELLPQNGIYTEMIIRAILFRLSVAALFSGHDHEKFSKEYNAFKPIIDYIKDQ
jgi:hypothetical protein